MELKANNSKIDVNQREILVRQIIFKVFIYGFLALFALFVLVPFYWMVLTSLKEINEVRKSPPSLIIGFSKIRFWANYVAAWNAAPYWRYMLNTVTVAAISTTGTVFTTIFAAFAFARLNFKGREIH